jgi:RNA polymerase sigma-70 factor (ECF subfamily)
LTGNEDRLDLMQEVCMKLSRSIGSVPASALVSEESILAYLKALAANAACDALRARFAAKRGEAETVPIEDRLPVLATHLDLNNTERATLLRQVDELLEASARERAVFWLYFRQGFTAREISLIPSVQLSVKGVESLLHRMTESVRSRMIQTRNKSASASEVTE